MKSVRMVGWFTLVIALAVRGAAVEITPRSLPAFSPLDLTWWSGFGDAQLNLLLSEALTDSPDVRMAAARLGVLETQVNLARAERIPSLTLEGGLGVRRYFPNARRQDPDINRPTPELSLGYEVDLWGRFARGISATEAARDAGAEDVVSAQLCLAADVARSWFRLRADAALQDLVTAQREKRKDLAAAKQALVVSGLEVRDQQWVEAELVGPLDLEQRSIREEQERLFHRLDTQRGLTTSQTFPIAPPLGEAKALALPANINTELIVQRPDVRAAKLRLEAQQARVGATRAAALPAIALIGKGFFTGDTLREFLRGGSLSGFLASQFTLPILNQERNRGRLEEARAEFSVAQEDFSGVVIRAFGECRDAVSAAEAAQSILRYREELQCRRKESLDAASRRRAAGLLGRLTILPLEDALFDAEKETVKARLTLLDAQVQLALTLALGAPTQTGSSRPSDAKPIQLREKIRAESLHPIHEKH